ncbi:unnamed protein product, partial [Nesidiocoris tenuis]
MEIVHICAYVLQNDHKVCARTVWRGVTCQPRTNSRTVGRAARCLTSDLIVAINQQKQPRDSCPHRNPTGMTRRYLVHITHRALNCNRLGFPPPRDKPPIIPRQL